MEKELLLKYIQGNCDDKEKLLFANWIDENSDHMKEYLSMRRLYDITSWQDISQENYSYFSNKQYVAKRTRTFTLIRSFSKIAAVFIVAISIGYFLSEIKLFNGLTLNETVVFQSSAPSGEKSTILLPDGTKVWLNSESTIYYSGDFSIKERTVKLEGEAYFNVAKDKDIPFVVNAGSMDIKVLGTKFNVHAYPDEEIVSATLEEGKIISYIKDANQNHELNPGQQIKLNIQTNSAQIVNVDTDLFTSWKDNLLSFQDAKFVDVIKKMERWYSVNIEVDEDLKVEKLYTLTIKTESLNEMLGLLAITTPIKYTINEDKVTINRAN